VLKRRRNKVAAPPRECALTVCLRYISGAWTPNILWYLGAEPRRFTELQHDLPGVSSKMLAARLKRLQRDGLVRRVSVPSSPPSVEYRLTDLGCALRPGLETFVAVGHKIKQRRF
jgi:DNA-binding HxlR family transcriptional regulator